MKGSIHHALVSGMCRNVDSAYSHYVLDGSFIGWFESTPSQLPLPPFAFDVPPVKGAL